MASICEAMTFFGGSGQPDHVKAVVSAMKDVAYGTQLCDPDLYEKGLRALEPAIRMLEDDSEASSLLHIFTDQIREDYGRLLDGKNRTAIDIIRWCVGKKLFQQALTFLESRMPAYFYQMRFYYYDPSFNVDISRRKPAAKNFMQSLNDEPEVVFSSDDVCVADKRRRQLPSTAQYAISSKSSDCTHLGRKLRCTSNNANEMPFPVLRFMNP